MKNDQDLFSIGEIAKALGVTRRIILHYEERGLIRPDGRDGATGNRYYTIDTFTQLRSIRSLQNLGLTLDEIRDYFQGSADLTPLIRRLEKMRDELNLNIEKLYERSKVTPAQVKAIALPPQRVYRRVYRSQSVAERTALLDHANARGLTPLGTLRHTYLEGPPQHKDPSKFITQVILPIAPRPEESEESEGPEE